MSAALERRLLALETKAGRQTNRFLWVSWQPVNPDDEVPTTQHGETVWQRQHNENLSAFKQRMQQAVGHLPCTDLIRASHARGSLCFH